MTAPSLPAVNSPVEAWLPRRAAAEAVGTGALVIVVVGSGIQATRLTGDVALLLLANSTATVLGLAVLIAVLGPISGAHLNPAVTLVASWSDRAAGRSSRLREPTTYIGAQVIGAAGGAVLANVMFGLPPVRLSTHARDGGSLWLAEVVATAGLVLVIFGLARTGREKWVPWAVAAYIGAAYWFTSSTSFANPAVTIGRALSDTFAGIAPASVPGFIAAQLVGALVGAVLLLALFGRRLPRASDVVLPHPSPGSPGPDDASDSSDSDTVVPWSPPERTPAP
ncbi:MAG: aquaporin [Gemmatimonadales bacterium]